MILLPLKAKLLKIGFKGVSASFFFLLAQWNDYITLKSTKIQ
jgi:hypothetical protein